ncbi:restriction endonuclease [Shewanella frigidimarina]|uniref:restriction endonuclease n=1 Tax=Shewanella frigidimarina TaxID=56812 RepID=UPI000F4E578E|nr:restriction endonuclease [Shewanella frigidimarina]RPA23017.1 restriction endonuclease [Shewanella frigidimarina]
MKKEDWYQFQELIREHFESLGADAETNVRLQGVRTCHDVDVLVKTKFLGEDITWVVEAKLWKTPVSKVHVLALRTIIDDIGADRGFIVSSNGFQLGAIEAANKSNVKLKTFDELKDETKGMIEEEVLKTYDRRLQIIESRYWSHSKAIRIKYGLRHDLLDNSMKFTGQILLAIARKAILAASERNYPIDVETFHKEHQGQAVAYNFQQLQNWLNLNLNHFEEKLMLAEWEMHKHGDYCPDTTYDPEDEMTPSQVMAAGMYRSGKNG